MSQSAVINYSQLEEFLEIDGPGEEQVRNWIEKLTEYDIDGSETPTEIELLYNGAKYLMSFAFTAAEELRDVAEHEAIRMAEKEDQWEEMKEQMREEIESLRERITSKAEIGDSSEAFRAQIDSLKEENRQLQKSNRERDREMADQRDRFENLASRVDTLTREREALSDHKIQLEDTIRELNRRLSSKTEETSGGEWENKKLKLRNEQVLTLSQQLQTVIGQNDDLRMEVDRLTDGLEEATHLIEQSASKHLDLTNQLENAGQRIEELEIENQALAEGIPSGLLERLPKLLQLADEYITGTSSDQLDFLMNLANMFIPHFSENPENVKALKMETGVAELEEIQLKLTISEDRVKELQEELNSVAEECIQLRAKVDDDRTGEKEQELEQLKKELMDATSLAKKLLGEVMVDEPGQDPTTALQIRILQLEQHVEDAKIEIETKVKTISELRFIIEQKDENNNEILADLNRLKDARYGSAREEFSRLEKQLKFRDEQLSKMQQYCTLLQVELGRYADGTYEAIVPPEKEEKISEKPQKEPKRPISKPSPRKEQKEEPKAKPEKPKSPEPPPEEQPFQISTFEQHPKQSKPTNMSDLAQQAVLISNLYYEIMQLLEELEIKDSQLIETHESWKKTKKINDELNGQLELAYGEIQKLKQENLTVEERALEDMRVNESLEMQRLVESINVGGDELERRMGEATRKLIVERMERIRLSRQSKIQKTKISRLEWAGQRAREMWRARETSDARKLVKMKYELDSAIIEIGKLQNRVLQSVPIDEYDKLMRKYKKLVKETTEVNNQNEEFPRQQLTITSTPAKDQEIEARENMLKKMIDVVSDQSEFWRSEAGILQSENEELKKFIEDIENENDLKSVLGAVERRLLDTIRELRENERDNLREKKRQKGHDSENLKDSERLRFERMALLNVINVLQRENRLLRDQSMGTVSLQQLEILRKKILETREKEEMINIIKSETEVMKEETEAEMLKARAQREASEISQLDNNEISDQLQYALFNASRQSAKVKSLEKTSHLKEQKLADCQDELRELKKWNLEILTALENVKEFRKEEKKVEKIQETVAISQNSEIHEAVERESDYEMDIRSDSDSSASSSARIIVKTIVKDNVDAFENRIKELKMSAQVALQGYKDQLELKDLAIRKYKQLLQEKIEEGVRIVERIETVQVEVENPATLEKLRSAEERTKRLEKELRVMKASKPSEEGERVAEPVDNEEKAVQTEIQSSRTRQEFEAEEVERPPTDNHEESHSISGKSERVRRMEEELQLMREELLSRSGASIETENQRMKSEIRDLKTRVQRLSRSNKELISACEKIKEDALEELSTFRRNNENVDERRMTELGLEVEKLRSINRNLRLSNEELKNELSKLRATATSLKNKKNEPSEWERRKKQEEVIENLKTKLKKKEILEKQMLENLEKRDKMVEMLRKDQLTRNSEIEKLQRRLKETNPTAIRNEIQQTWQQKVIGLEAALLKKENEHSTVTKSLTRLKTDYESLKSQKIKEIQKLEKEKLEVIQRLTDEYQQVSKKSIMNSHSSQTEKVKLRDVETKISPKERNSEFSKSYEESVTISDYQSVTESLKMTQNRLIESQEKLLKMEKDYQNLAEKFERLKVRITRDDKPTGAVLVLSDKLAAKDREIAQLKNQIAHFQRSINLSI